MKDFFSNRSKKELQDFLDCPTLLALDFDGTLAPLVKDPYAAKMNSRVEKALQEISILTPVLVISGRSLADLKKRLSWRPRHLIGNHGVEKWYPGLNLLAQKRAKRSRPKVKVSPEDKLLELFRNSALEWKKAFLSLSSKRKEEFEGLFVEVKNYSVSLHYRNSKDQKRVHSKIMREVRKLDPKPRVVQGKWVVNLVHPKAHHKGQALTHLMKQLKTKKALFFGDDVTDEDIFRLSTKKVFGVRVGTNGHTRAQYCIRRQSEIVKALNLVLKELRRLKNPPKSQRR